MKLRKRVRHRVWLRLLRDAACGHSALNERSYYDQHRKTYLNLVIRQLVLVLEHFATVD